MNETANTLADEIERLERTADGQYVTLPDDGLAPLVTLMLNNIPTIISALRRPAPGPMFGEEDVGREIYMAYMAGGEVRRGPLSEPLWTFAESYVAKRLTLLQSRLAERGS